jgi:large subunit ribosomal protein L29
MTGKWIKSQKLRDKSIDDLRNMVEEMKAAKFTARFQLRTGKLENFQLMRQERRRLATLLTLIREKELQSQATEDKG